jgi:hypothetical protein
MPEIINLERFRLKTQHALSAELSHREDLYGNIIFELEAELLGYISNPHLQHDEIFTNTITRPRFADPWQHLKARYAGRSWFRWFVKRYPIKFVEEKFSVSIRAQYDLKQVLTFPECKIKFPPGLGPVQVMAQENFRKIDWSGPVDNQA